MNRPTISEIESTTIKHVTDLFDFYGVSWEYEPRTFILDEDEDGSDDDDIKEVDADDRTLPKTMVKLNLEKTDEGYQVKGTPKDKNKTGAKPKAQGQTPKTAKGLSLIHI